MVDLTHPVLIGTAAAILVYVYLLRSRKRLGYWIEVWISWIPGLARRPRQPASRTPPRSLSPAKLISPSIPLGFWDAFPPSCRETLEAVAPKSPEARRKYLIPRDVDQATFEKNLISFTTNFATCGPFMYTPTRISTDEIKALGDFPDYAGLSGVPLPEAYREFRIESALPRPYRPLRWAYHQTMCMFDLTFLKRKPNLAGLFFLT